MSKMTIWHIQV